MMGDVLRTRAFALRVEPPVARRLAGKAASIAIAENCK
jgi:hypothetical protein